MVRAAGPNSSGKENEDQVTFYAIHIKLIILTIFFQRQLPSDPLSNQPLAAVKNLNNGLWHLWTSRTWQRTSTSLMVPPLLPTLLHYLRLYGTIPDTMTSAKLWQTAFLSMPSVGLWDLLVALNLCLRRRILGNMPSLYQSTANVRTLHLQVLQLVQFIGRLFLLTIGLFTVAIFEPFSAHFRLHF